jgi:hypothetical protein
MMVGGIVAVAVVIAAFFGAGIVFGVAWIYAMSVRRARKPQPSENQAAEYDIRPSRR